MVAHLLHDDLRRISRGRDRYSVELAALVGRSLVDRLNEANQRWVADTGFLARSCWSICLRIPAASSRRCGPTRICTRRVVTDGDQTLAEHLFQIVSVVR
jgi:hypothetical protein